MFSSGCLEHELKWRIENFRKLYQYPRLFQLDVDYDVTFSSTSSGAINDLTLDALESRFLLAAYQDGSIVLFDTETASAADGQLTHTQLSRIDTCPPVPNSPRRFRKGLSPAVCAQWYPVDSGTFFTASLDKTVRVWDTNRLECVDSVELAASICWIDLSKCATTHNLIAVALGSSEDGRAVLIDPVIGAKALTLIGGHSPAGLSQVLWSTRSPHILLTGGYEGRVLFWDIRKPTKPVFALDKYGDGSGSTFSPTATAHTGSVLSLAFSIDGLHLFSWGGAGATEDALCLRMWSCGPAGLSESVSSEESQDLRWPQLRPVNFGSVYIDSNRTVVQPASLRHLGVSDGSSQRATPEQSRRTSDPPRVRPKEIPVRMAVASGAPAMAWGAQASVIYAPCRSRIFVAVADRYDASNRLVNRHYNKVRACVWNENKQELYTGGMDGNLLTWSALTTAPTSSMDVDS